MYCKASSREPCSVLCPATVGAHSLDVLLCRLAKSNVGDLWMPTIVFIALLASFIEGLIKLVGSANPQNTLLISLVWVVYNMIPPALLFWYNFIGHGSSLRVRLSAAHLGRLPYLTTGTPDAPAPQTQAVKCILTQQTLVC